MITPFWIFFSEGTVSIKDYDMQCLKLRAVSRNLWEDFPLQENLTNVLLSAASSLFKQVMILVPEVSFLFLCVWEYLCF